MSVIQDLSLQAPPEPKESAVILSEQRKLTAAWLNIVGAGIASAGVISQVAPLTADGMRIRIAIAGAAVIVGDGIHLAARAAVGQERA